MPLPQRVSQPTRDTLATQFATNYGAGPATVALSNATADLQRMPHKSVRAILRKVADTHTIGAVTTDIVLKQGVTTIASGGSDTVANTVAGAGTSRVYSLTNPGSVLLTVDQVVISSLVNCTVSVVPTASITQPAIQQDGSVVSAVGAVAPIPANVPALGLEMVALIITPTAAGAWSFAVSLANAVVAKNPYLWSVSGTAVAAAPTAAVLVGATPVADGGTDAIGSKASTVLFARTFTINNTGGADLGITVPVVLGTPTNATVTVVSQPAATVPAFGSTTYVVNVTPTAPGAFSFTVSFANTDAGAGKNPYNWTSSGTAT